MATSSYTEYVITQSKRNPCLRNLCHFLADNVSRNLCRITSLDFSKPDGSITRNDFDINDLSALLNATASDSPGEIQGRLLIVEDLTKEVIELLGSSLDIDPLFFASHIDGPYMTIESSKPCSAILPSQMKKQNFFSIQYHGTVDFGGNAAGLRRLFSDSNVPRKVMVLPPAQGMHIGLAQHSCSVLKTNLKGNSWLGLILVDPPPRTTYRSLEKEMTLQSQPFQGGYEDFLQRQSFASGNALDSEFMRSSLMEDLVYYWTKERPPVFHPKDPDVLFLAYYPLKIVAAEWNCYIEVIVHSIKQYEYSTERSQPSAQNEALATLDADLRALQKWGRRCIQTLNKLNGVTRFISARNRDQTMRETYGPILEDYEHIIDRVKTYAARLETMVHVTTSLVQIVDSRRSLREAANVTRLTNLALLFVPLSFVTGLFGMNDGISGHAVALFFSVAAPLCFSVFFVANLPYIRWQNLPERIRRLSYRREF